MEHQADCKCDRCRPFGGATYAESLASRALKSQDRYYLERLRDKADDMRKRDKGG